MKTNYDFTENGSFEVNKDGTLFINNSDGNCIYSKNPNGYKQWNDYDKNNNLIHFKNSYGDEEWYEYDKNNNEIHFKSSSGYETWTEYDLADTLIHVKKSNGYEEWYDSNGYKITKEEFDSIHNQCAGKTVTIDEKEYTLTPM